MPDCTGPGGGGAGGTIWAAGPGFPGAVTATVNGGANGVVSSGSFKSPSCQGASNGATPGSAGQTLHGFTAPVSSGPVCVALTSPALQYFNATRTNRDILLSWALISPQTAAGIRDFVLQRSSDLSNFTTVATLTCSKDSITYHYTDGGTYSEGTVAYRLTWQDANGEWSYSRIVAVAGMGPDGSSIRIYPDPATNYLTLTLLSSTNESATLSISSALGQSLFTQHISLFKGLNTVTVPIETLAPAAYFLVLQSAGNRLVRPFLKKIQ